MSDYQDCESRSACDEFREELTNLKQKLTWRPISTAPKDGSHVLLRYRFAYCEIYVAEGWWSSNAAWCCHGHPSVRAIHWMPLPEEPK